MVKLTVDMITKAVPGQNKRRADETASHYLNRLTHIYLQEKNIEHIDVIPVCKNLTVIYLYDNTIEKIENFEFAPNLTHLYLQNNRIKRLENLANNVKLTKLHLGGNEIKVLEGLENLSELVELQIENQRLPSGEKFLFDPRSLASLATQLRVLNISGNNLESLEQIGSLTNLSQLFAANNKLNDMKEMGVLLQSLVKLSELELTGNPLCSKNKYRERIIVMASNIVTLDGKEIKQMSRQFLQNWKTSKEEKQQQQQQQLLVNTNSINNIKQQQQNQHDAAKTSHISNLVKSNDNMSDIFLNTDQLNGFMILEHKHKAPVPLHSKFPRATRQNTNANLSIISKIPEYLDLSK